MLGFKDYRRTISEVGTPGPLPDETDPAPPRPPIPPQAPPPPARGRKPGAPSPDIEAVVSQIQQQVDQMVVQWVNDLKKQLYTGQAKVQPRSLWDRFKGGLANMWYGRQNVKNPYYWKNRLGDELGAKQEEFRHLPFSLGEYKELRGFFEDFERGLNEDYQESPETSNLRINQIINSKANELRQKLGALITQQFKNIHPSELSSRESSDDDEGGGAPTPPHPKRQKKVTLPADITDWKEPSSEMKQTSQTVACMNMRVSSSGAVNCINGFTADPNGAAKWNSFGGGPTVTDMSKFPPPSGAGGTLQPFELPIILRIGDPRLALIRTYYTAVYNELVASKRVEDAAKRITDENTMKEAIRAATNFRPR